MTTVYEVLACGSTTMPPTSRGSYADTSWVTAWPNKSSPILPINCVGTPSLCNARPVLDTGPPVESATGPTSIKCPGMKAARNASGVMPVICGMMSRQRCPATIALSFSANDGLLAPEFWDRSARLFYITGDARGEFAG